MNLDWTAIVTGLAAPVTVMMVKYLLDLSLAQWFVKRFSWVPVRSILRDRWPNLSGRWEQTWGAGGSLTFANEVSRHSYTEMKQFGPYLYAEFDAKGSRYVFFGKVRGQYVVAEWYDCKDRFAYFGAAQLRVIKSSAMEGCYVGHSHRTGLVGSDAWNWVRHVD